MTMTFMSSPSLLMTSESVTEGHPDKLCDQIADAILDEIIAHDPEAHVACEVTTTTGLVAILGASAAETNQKCNCSAGGECEYVRCHLFDSWLNCEFDEFVLSLCASHPLDQSTG